MVLVDHDVDAKLVGKHPVLAGLPLEWEVPKEELYYSDKVWPTATPLGEAMSTDRNAMQTCIWTNQYGKTRVFNRVILNWRCVLASLFSVGFKIESR